MSKTNRATGVKVAALLRPETINLNLHARDKVGVLREVASLLSQSQRVANFEVFLDEILERERISSTARAYDVAIPHARTDQCNEILLAVGRSVVGVDFGVPNSQPVRLVFLIGTPKRMVTEYLRVVGNLARLLRQDALRAQLLAASDAASFIQLLDVAES